MKNIKIPQPLKKMNEIFQANGFEAYLVGGAVRDMIRGKEASDWDVATSAQPEQVVKIFRKVIPTGIAHGTVTVLFMGHSIEVTTYRTEADYSDGRHPDSVNFAGTIEEDLSRRDFTMNAIAASLEDGHLVDPFAGQEDIKSKTIRTVGNPYDRFNEDGLRPIRAIRFASQLGFSITPETMAAIPASLEKTATISVERFREEFIKILKSPEPSVGLKLLEETGILQLFIPELATCRKVEQADCRGFHQFDVLDHLFYACDGAPAHKELVRLAALLHDIGKPKAKRSGSLPDGRPTITFYNHEKYSEEMSQNLMTRLKFSKAETATVCHLVKNHMFHYESNWSDAAVRRFLFRVTPEALEDLFDLRMADVYGMTRSAPVLKEGPWSSNLLELKDRITELSSQQQVLGLKDLAINGKDLMAAGIPAGKQLGTILNQLLETVLDDPSQNNRQQLLTIATKLAEKYCN